MIAAKQEAFEEANKLKNQFRALDEDEIEYLDSVMESTRKEEDRVRKETREGLELFRKQQEEQDKKARGQQNAGDGEAGIGDGWTAGSGRKRKRAKDKEVLKGVKVRRASTNDEKDAASTRSLGASMTERSKDSIQGPEAMSKASVSSFSKDPSQVATKKEESKVVPKAAKSSLVAYGSDSDDD